MKRQNYWWSEINITNEHDKEIPKERYLKKKQRKLYNNKISKSNIFVR